MRSGSKEITYTVSLPMYGGLVDGVFITTTAIGKIRDGVKAGGALAQLGDAVIVTGDVGRHCCDRHCHYRDAGQSNNDY